MDLADVRPLGRDTQGVSLMRPGEHASVIGVAMVLEDEVDEVDEPGPTTDPLTTGPTTAGPATSGISPNDLAEPSGDPDGSEHGARDRDRTDPKSHEDQ
jgi:hypothetical protein